MPTGGTQGANADAQLRREDNLLETFFVVFVMNLCTYTAADVKSGV